ncbi:MAG TPA: hypothetical protein VLG27_01185 [Candidatus Saccharimonadia bacterium]|nr:hypothetical protein [Candidatus Saccharimonadia bacterium]
MVDAAEYTERLVTPHPRLNKPDSPQPLGFVIREALIAEDLEGLEDQGKEKFKTRLAAADYIALQVRSALWVPQATRKRNDFVEDEVSNPPTLEDLKRKQVAACTGFTLVTSVYLEDNGIDHWVGFANGHWLVAIDSEEDRSLQLIDPMTPEVGQNAWTALINSSVKQTQRNLETIGRAAVLLNGHRLWRNMRPMADEKAVYPWMEEQASVNVLGQQKIADKIAMSFFQPEEGQDVIQAYSRFRHASINNDLEAATRALDEIGPRFPNMDARNRHTELRWVIAGLANSGRFAEAKRIIRSYFETFTFIDDSRFHEAEGDALKLLARASSDPDVAQEAIESYERALKMPKSYHRAVEGKITKLSKQKEKMSSTREG